jgi:UTP--glucose-1-phosphate uridylyltransferase
MDIVIPAAGLGTRFLPRFPKEALPLGGRPLLAHALHEAAGGAFERALVVLSEAKTALIPMLQTWAEGGLAVEHAIQRRPRGPGDAILEVAGRLRGAVFGVLFPDDVVTGVRHWFRLRDLQARTGAASILVRPVPAGDVARFGIARCEKEDGHLRVRALVEKPAVGSIDSNLAIFGRYLIDRRTLHALQSADGDGELQLTAGLDAVARADPGVVAAVFDGEIYDCGTPAEYERSIERFPNHA